MALKPMPSAADEPEEKKVAPTGPVTIKLRVPISFGQQTIFELTFRPAKAKDFRRLPEGKMDQLLAMAGRLSGQPDPVIGELSMDDMMEVSRVVEGFMPDTPSTGGEA